MFRFHFGRNRTKTPIATSARRPLRQRSLLLCEMLEDRLLLAGQAAWTVMVYLTADDKLASGLNGNIKQLESALAGLNATDGAGAVQIAVLYDQSRSSTANLFATPITSPNGTLPAQTWSNTGEAILQPNAADPASRGITTPFTLLGPQDTSQ